MTSSYPAILDELGRGRPVQLAEIGGGCIARAMAARFADGSRVFVKTAQGSEGMFECEAQGLQALAAADAIRVPQVLGAAKGVLVLEFIDSASPGPRFFESFGRSFARLHEHRGPAFGFPHDNFIGSTPQPNTPLSGSWNDCAANPERIEDGSSWPEFFLQRRLRFQTELAGENGHGYELQSQLDHVERRILDSLEASIEPPSILHGDLWSGNFMADENGDACVIDPAAYFGHREADLAMTRLFGGFAPEFYAAYQEVSPLAPGHEERLSIYQLYHLLNHLNLFGQAYYGQCRRILQRFS